MRWINGLTWEAEKKQKSEWHKWFAWHPVVVRIINQGTKEARKQKAWLETIWRRGEYACCWGECGWDWEYSVEEPVQTPKNKLPKAFPPETRSAFALSNKERRKE